MKDGGSISSLLLNIVQLYNNANCGKYVYSNRNIFSNNYEKLSEIFLYPKFEYNVSCNNVDIMPINWKWYSNKKNLNGLFNIYKNLKFSEKLERYQESFVFDMNNKYGSNWLCVHLRLEKDWTKYMCSKKSVYCVYPELLKKILNTSKHIVFVMSVKNTSPKILEMIDNEFKNYSFAPSFENLSYTENSAIHMLISKNAPEFYGNTMSTFSRGVAIMRNVEKKKSSSYDCSGFQYSAINPVNYVTNLFYSKNNGCNEWDVCMLQHDVSNTSRYKLLIEKNKKYCHKINCAYRAAKTSTPQKQSPWERVSMIRNSLTNGLNHRRCKSVLWLNSDTVINGKSIDFGYKPLVGLEYTHGMTSSDFDFHVLLFHNVPSGNHMSKAWLDYYTKNASEYWDSKNGIVWKCKHKTFCKKGAGIETSQGAFKKVVLPNYKKHTRRVEKSLFDDTTEDCDTETIKHWPLETLINTSMKSYLEKCFNNSY